MKSSEKKRQHYFEAKVELEQPPPYPKNSSNTVIDGGGSGSNYTKMLRSPIKDKIEIENFDSRVSIAKQSEKISEHQLQLKNMVLDCKIILISALIIFIEDEDGLRIYRRHRDSSQNGSLSLGITPLRESATPSVSPDVISPSLLSL
jgi:hypothetical protein